MPDLVVRAHARARAIAIAQRSELRLKGTRGLLRGGGGAGERADAANQPRHVRQARRLAHPHGVAQALQPLDVAGLVAGFPGEHEVGLQGDDALEIDARRIADLRQGERGSGIVAEAGGAGEAVARAGGIRDFGEMRSQGDDPAGGYCEPDGDAAIVNELEGVRGRRCENNRRDEQARQAAPRAKGGYRPSSM
jgi:hypothetical protein